MASNSNKLGKLLHLIVDQKICVIDDSLLEKLLTHLQQQIGQKPIESEQNFDMKDQLLQLDVKQISNALIQPELDPTILSFGLKLVGYASRNTSIDCDIARQLIVHWNKKVSKSGCSATIRNAGLSMLIEFTSNDTLKEVIAQAGAITTAITLLSDNSMFVCTQAQNFMAQFFVRSLSRPKTDSKATNMSNKVAAEALNYMMNSLSTKSDCRCIIDSCTSVLKLVCEKKEFVEQHQQIKVMLIYLLMKSREEFFCSRICDVIVVIQQHTGDDGTVNKMIKHLLDSDLTDVALKLCAKLITNCRSSNSATELQSTIHKILESSLENSKKTDREMCRIVSHLLQVDWKSTSIEKEFHEKCTSWLCNLIHQPQWTSSRLKLTVLDGLLAILSTQNRSQVVFCDAINVTSEIITARAVEVVVLVKALSVLSSILQIAPLNQDIVTHISNTANSLAHLLFHPSWEVQDSTMEFIATLTTLDSAEIQSSILHNQLHCIVWKKATSADESFVRATALATVGCLANQKTLWTNFLESQSEENVICHLLRALSEDTEAVVRRSAINATHKWYKHPGMSCWTGQFRLAMQKAMSDLDWEVKLGALAFWMTIFQDAEVEYQLGNYDEQVLNRMSKEADSWSKALAHLDNFGFCKSLLIAIDDYDISVKLKAANYLKSLKHKLIQSRVILTRSDEPAAMDVCDYSSLQEDRELRKELVSCDPLDLEIMEEVLNTQDCEEITKTLEKTKLSTDQIEGELTDSGQQNIETVTVEYFLDVLSRLDLADIVKEGESNADLYEDNLTLLIEDMLAMQRTEMNADVILDCY